MMFPKGLFNMVSVFYALYQEFPWYITIFMLAQMISMAIMWALAYVWAIYTLSRPEISAVFQRKTSQA